MTTRRSATGSLIQTGLKLKEFWLRGMDLNHRPLGYERTYLWLCS
jgi:hypothetical protein